MSVIINQLEITTGPPPPAESPPGSLPGGQGTAPPTPMELDDVMRHLAERRERLAAD